MTKWNEVPTPSGINTLPKDNRGYPVPVITPREDTNFFLGKQDNWRVLWCFLDNLCSVCGGVMNGAWRFYTPPFEENGMDNVYEKFIELCQLMSAKEVTMGSPVTSSGPSEAPFHLECGLYSLAVCPYLASPSAKFTAIKELGGPVIDRRGMYLGEANIATFDKLTLRATWHAPKSLLDDDKEEAINILQQSDFPPQVIPSEWSLPEGELRSHIWKRLESNDRRMYHRARQGKGVWGKAF